MFAIGVEQKQVRRSFTKIIITNKDIYPEVDHRRVGPVRGLNDVDQVLEVVWEEGLVIVSDSHGLSLRPAELIHRMDGAQIPRQRRVESHQPQLRTS